MGVATTLNLCKIVSPILENFMQFVVATSKFLQFCAVERRLSPHTTDAYKSDLTDFQRWFGMSFTTTEISNAHLKDYLQHMIGERKLTTSTVRRRLACLRSFFKFAADLGQTSNPFEGWHLQLARRRRLPRTLSRAEASCLLSPNSSPAATPTHIENDFGVVVRLMVSTGLRVGEVCKLHTEDISFDGAMIRVRGKGSKERIAYVTDPELAGALQRLRVERGPTGVAPLFINRRGTGMKPQTVRLQLRRIAQEVGLVRRITPHMLRHTAATLLIETGVDIRFVQRLLGHSSIATTEIYTHVSDEALRTTLTRANILGSFKAS
jgi:site-specific recombinase XerD